MPKNKTVSAAIGGSVESSLSIPLQPTESPTPLIVPKFGMAEGGKVTKQTQRMLKEGGMMQEGGTVDPVSGNDVPVGAMQEEVRDDIPAQLSEGEFVFPADVVRFIGLERLMMMRQAAKEGLGKMEDMGQMSNADEATMEDDSAFESQIDEIMGGLDEEGEEEDVEMAEGGMATNPAAMAQTQQALAQDQQPQPQNTELTEDQLNAINRTAEAMASQSIEVPAEKQSKPTEGLKASDIIKNNLMQSKTPEETNAFLNKIAQLEKTQKIINVRHNDTVVLGFVKSPGVVDPVVFSENGIEEFDQAINATLSAFKKAGIKRLESTSSDRMALEYLTAKNFPIEKGTPQSGFTWALNL